MALIDQYTLSLNTTFAARVQEAALQSAVAVYNEPSTTTGHPLRARFATLVLNQQANMNAIVGAVAQNAALSANPTDNDITFTLNSVWNALSGS